MPASCFWALSKVACFIGSPLVSSNVFIALSSARNCASTSFDVCRVESASRQGCRMRDTLERRCLQTLPTPCQWVSVVAQAATRACACATWAGSAWALLETVVKPPGLSSPCTMECGEGLLTAFGLSFTPHIECKTRPDLRLRPHAIDVVLHLAIAPVAAFHRIRRGG